MRVATYNLYLGVDLSLLFGVSEDRTDEVVTELVRQLAVTDFPARAGAVARLLVAHDVDLVGLQEVTRWCHDGDVLCDFQDELTRELVRLGGSFTVHAVNHNFAGAGAGLSLRGSNVILARDTVVVREERTGCFDSALAVPTPWGLTAIARSWGWIDAEVSGRPVRFATTHTEAYDERVRDAQRDELLAVLGEPDVPVVVAGDFNAPPDRVGIPPSFSDAWTAAGGDPAQGFTCGQAADLSNRTSSLHERIDYVWVRGLPVRRCWVAGGADTDRTAAGLWPSDHACVIADLGGD